MWTTLGQQEDRWWPGMQSSEVWTSRLTHSMARSGAGCQLGAQQWFSTCIPAHMASLCSLGFSAGGWVLRMFHEKEFKASYALTLEGPPGQFY